MFPRPSYRLTVLLLGALTLLTFISLLESWMKSYSHNRISIISPPVHEPNPAPKKIKAFWATWADIFEQAKPKIGKIKFDGQASTADSDKANGDRVPGPSLLQLSQKSIDSMKASHSILLQKLKDFDKDNVKGLFSGTGVVMVAGGKFFPPAITSIRMLRKSGSKLPVHIFLQSREEYEHELCEDYLPSINAECFVLEDFLRRDHPYKVTHFQLKALAILFSPFETILFLDSDCIPLRNPSELLSSEPFLSTGLITWPDYWIATEDPVFYQIAGLDAFPPNVPARSSESGQILISKDKHLTSLLLASYYNVFGPDYFYPILSQGALGEGDKETFMAGAIVLKNPHYAVRRKVGTIGYFDEAGEFKGGAMVQHHPGDEYAARKQANDKDNNTADAEPKAIRPFFLHANYPKMNLGHLVDEPRLKAHGGDHRRLWGPKESTIKQFGMDVERVVWNEMVEPGCGLQDVIWDWRGRDRICDRAREHWGLVFKDKNKRRKRQIHV